MRTHEEELQYHRQWRAKNKDKVREYNRRKRLVPNWKEENKVRFQNWRARNPEKIRAQYRRRFLKYQYGITLSDYENMLENQGYNCALCLEKSPYDLVVDHNHNTNQIRALLCRKCNLFIGVLEKASNALLARALDYIKR